MPAERAKRILVVDHNESVRGLIVRALWGEGYEEVAVRDGMAGLEAALGAGEPYDLVITSGHMPHIDGRELTARLRARRPKLPIIHLDDLSPSFSDLPNNVPNFYKPFSGEALINGVRRLLGGRATG
ncbi:MAG: response regulator [Gemmatimonadales bacterium]